MSKCKKLISMLLAFIMLATSCSLSFFAFASDADIQAAESLAETALDGANANTVQAADTAFINKVKSLSVEDAAKMKPLYYAYALHVATTAIVRAETNKNPTAAQRAAKLLALGNGDATVTAKYESYITVVPAYVTVIKDFNDLNTKIGGDSVLTSVSNIQMITAALTNVNFPTNATAKGLYETFWNSYKNYNANQLLFADFLPITTANGVTNAFTAGTAATVMTKRIRQSSTLDPSLNYYFGNKTADRFSDLYFLYSAQPVNAAVAKAKYLSGSSWTDPQNGPTLYYNELKQFYTNANDKVKTFYVNYLSEFANASAGYEGLDEIGDVIDVGLKLKAGESVPFAQVKAAYNKYNGLKAEGKALIEAINNNSTYALFNPEMADIGMKENIVFEGTEQEINDAITYISENVTTITASNNATKYNGDKIKAIIQAVIDEYNKNKALDEFEELVNATVAKDTITQADVDAVWDKFTNANEDGLSAEQRLAVKDSGELWTKVEKIMTSQFVQYVNAVDMNSVTDENRTQSTALLNDTKVETVDETKYDFKKLITTSNTYKTVYNKYKQIQIDKFRKYVEGVDLNSVTEENRTQAKALYEELGEFQSVAQADNALYSKYLKILASEFKDYVKSVDLDKVDDAKRAEAAQKYQELTEDAKKTAYEDPETWEKYCAIQTPDTDPDKHEAEAAKKADKVKYPTSDSEAIKALGKEKAIDNVENFIIDDLLPNLTDQIVITDKKDVVNSALKQHLSAETVSKIYSFYAKISHNKDEVDPVNLPGVKVCDIVPLILNYYYFSEYLYEDDFSGAKAKIAQVIASGQVPTDEDGNPVQVPCGTNADGTTIYEDANRYDAIAAIEFTDADFGITGNDRDKFEAALLAVLRPVTSLCSPYSPLYDYLNVNFFNHVDKNTGLFTYGVYECAVKLLEALGVTGLPTDAQYKQAYDKAYNDELAKSNSEKACAIAGDQLLKPAIDGVFRLVDSELKTLPDLLALFPRLGDLVQSNIPENVYANLVRSAGALAPMIEDVEIEGQKLGTITKKGVLAPALLNLINNKLSGLGIKLRMPNWNVLNKYTTFKVNKSAQLDKDYVAVRYIGGDDMFTEAVYYLYDNLFANKANATALKDKIGGFPLVGENMKGLIEKAEKAGKMKTYAAILDYFYDNGENKDATADAGKSIGDAIKSLNNTLNLSQIDASNATVKLTKRKFAYNGKIQKPSVKVTLDGEVLKKGIAYKVKYSKDKSKKIGRYKVTVKFIGAYKGPKKTLKYTIGPKNARKIKLKSKKGAFKVKYKKSKSKCAKGYYIEYSTNKKFKNSKKVKVTGRSTTKKTIGGLESGKKYYVRIKSYTVKGGKKIYSPFSNRKAVKVK